MNSVPQKKLRRNKWLFIALAPFLVVAGGGGWLISSESGLQWLAGVIERQSRGSLSMRGIDGTLLDTFSMQQLVLRGEGWRITLRDMKMQWQPAGLLTGKLKVQRLGARQVEVLSVPSDKPLVLPDSLSLPLDMNVMKLKVDSLSVLSSEGAAPVFIASDIEARFEGDARRFQLQALRARLPYGDLAGSGEIAFDKPYVLKTRASLDSDIEISGRSVRAHLSAEADGDLQRIGVKFDGQGEGISASGAAQLEPFLAVAVSGLQLDFSGVDMARLFEGGPSAVLSGNVELRGMPGGELEGSLQVRNARAAPQDRNGLPLHGASARVRLSSSLWQLQQLDAHLLNDGHITGAVSWEQRNGKLSGQLKLHELDPAALDTRLPSTKLQGETSFESAGGDQKATVALSDGKLDLYGEIKRRGEKVELSSMRLTRGDTVLNGHGQLVMDRRRTFRFSSQLSKLDLSEFAAIPATDLSAALEVSGTLLPEAEGTLRFNLFDSLFAQQDTSGNGQIEFSGMRRAAGKIELQIGDNHLSLDVVHDTQRDRAELRLDAKDLAQLDMGVGGQLAGHAELSGSLAAPRLQFSAQGRELTLPGGLHIAALDATGDLAEAAMHMKLGVTNLRGTGALNMPEASVVLNGDRKYHALLATARIAQGKGTVGDVTLQASGGLSDPVQGWQALQWRGALDELTAQGALPFHLLAAAPLSFAKDSIHLGTADVAVAGGHIEFSEMQWTPQRLQSVGRYSGINVRAVNMQQKETPASAFDSIHIGGTWDATMDEHWKGRLQVQRESGDWVINSNTGLRLGLRDMQLSLRAEQDRVHAQLDVSGEHLGEVKARASAPLTRTDTGWTILPDAALAGHLHLRSDDLSWIGPMLDSNLKSGGRLNFDTELIGTVLSPRLTGVAEGDALSLSMLDQGIQLEQGELKVRFESDTIHVDRFAFSAPYLPMPRDKLLVNYTLPAGAGRLSASGSIDLKGGSGDMHVTAERLPLIQRADRWVIASGTGHASYAGNALMLDGNFRADAGLINQPSANNRPRWSEDVQIVGQQPASQAGLPISADATLDLGDNFYIRASGLEGRLAGQLKIRDAPDAPLSMTGTIAAQDAVFDAYGQRLAVERGMVNFQGPLDDPGLNILALRKGLDVEAGVEVTGTVRRPVVRLVSTPNVPDNEKMSWIVLGRVPESGGVDSALLVAAAGSILGGQSAGQFGRTLGVDEISLSQEAGEDAQQINKVTVGKQLSARTRISYEQELSETGGITKFTYTLTPRITIVTSTGTEDALDLFYTFRFD